MFLFGVPVWLLAGTFLSVSLLLSLVCLAVRRASLRRLDDFGATRSIVALVVGDLGRSPRMQNHALCVSERFCSGEGRGSGRVGSRQRSGRDCSERQDKINNNHVYLVGYEETACGSAVTCNKHITLLGLGRSRVDRCRGVLPLWVFLPAKVLEQSFKVFRVLMGVPNLSGIVLQVPPSIPSIPVSLLVSFLRGAPLVVDWHNYGHTLLVSETGGSSASPVLARMYRRLLVSIYRALEFSLGRLSHSSLCVSRAMQEDLLRRGIRATVVYDRPNGNFRPLESVSQRHSVLFKYFGGGGGRHHRGVPAGEREGRGGRQRQRPRGPERRARRGRDGAAGPEESSADRPGSSPTRVAEASPGAGARPSLLERPGVGGEAGKQLRERWRASAKSPRLPGPLAEEAFFLDIEPRVLEEISPSAGGLDLRQLLTREDLFLEDEVLETSPATELVVSCDQVDNRLALKVRLRRDRPAVLLTSTSWTPDEDLDLLLEGLVEYDREASRQSQGECPSERLPDVFLVITGKGPGKQSWLERASGTRMSRVEIRTVFVEADDYPRLLASSDLGISLHRSSSGLDLPMKVVDMLGAGIPVISFSYPTMGELLKGGDRLGLFFSDSRELCARLTALLRGFGSSCDGPLFPSPGLNRVSRSNGSRRRETFYQEWTGTAVRHFDEMVI